MKNVAIDLFVCSECGNESQKWSGKCFSCGAWNTLKEFKIEKKDKKRNSEIDNEIIDIDKIEVKNFNRINAQIGEFNRVLGGGIVPGSVILLGGDPGIGKSTLLLEVASKIKNVLYVSGEESPNQIKMRACRLKIKSNTLSIFAETDIDNIILEITKLSQKGLDLVVIDSIQTVYDSSYPSTPGSIIQVKECALKLQQVAKKLNISIVIVGHVTKDGSVAGPKTLEHLVDVVLYFEGERYQNTRILRGIKNRFGATDEIGVFEMTENGFIEVENPSKIFLDERLNYAPGSIVTAAMEGTRPFLVEIQALTTPTSFGYPKRTSSGFDLNRLQLLVAVLSKRSNINLFNQDVYLNIVGGFKLNEPASDLAVCLAIASAYKNKIIHSNVCAFGEIGLSGEIRKVNFYDKRIAEANRLGFTNIIKEKTISETINKIFNK